MTMPDAFDELLATAMKAQGEPAASPDLAARAMERARLAEERAAALMRLGRWLGWCSVAAGLLVLAVLGVAWWQFAPANVGNSVETVATVSSGEGGVGVGVLGCVLLVIAVVGTTLSGLARGPQEFAIKNLA